MAAALFERLPPAEKVRPLGFEPDDYARGETECWPENWPVFEVLLACRTQWRISMGGPTGLDYIAVFGVMDRLGVPPDEQRTLMLDLQVMEAAALAEMAKTFD